MFFTDVRYEIVFSEIRFISKCLLYHYIDSYTTHQCTCGAQEIWALSPDGVCTISAGPAGYETKCDKAKPQFYIEQPWCYINKPQYYG